VLIAPGLVEENMADWDVRLFGEPCIQCHGKLWTRPESKFAQEIFLFLLSHRRTAHSRESLASLLWGECSTEQSKKNLRQTLWRLRSCDALPADMKHVFLASIDKDHIQLNPAVDYWVDTEVFEQAYHELKASTNVHELLTQRLREAVQLYRGDFLEGYWHDWCLFERERFRNMYLGMTDKLIERCLSLENFDEGLDYAERILTLDPASERAHQQIMRLYHLSGNRTAALRQFERCVKHLKEELDVTPSVTTLKILAQIRSDGVDVGLPPLIHAGAQASLSLPQLSGRLKQFHAKLTELQKQIQQDIELVERFLPNRPN
jgi:DNA-binding SARP family transcriptional activator